ESYDPSGRTLSLHDALPSMAVGIEAIEDILADLDQALTISQGVTTHALTQYRGVPMLLVKEPERTSPDSGTSSDRRSSPGSVGRSEEHTAELHSRENLVCRL